MPIAIDWCWPLGSHVAVLDGRTAICDLEMGCGGQQVNHWCSSHEGKLCCNCGIGSSHKMARAAVLDGFKPEFGDAPDCLESRKAFGWSIAKPDLEQANKIMEIIDEGCQAGALSCASTVGYMRDGVSARELFEIVKIAAACNRPCSMHFRGTPGTEVAEVNGIQELMCNAVALGTSAIACREFRCFQTFVINFRL